LGLRQGTGYPIIARSSPQVVLGGIADLGIPGVDALVGRRTGADLGLISNVALMVNAPGADPAALATAVKGLLDPQANVVNLHGEAKQQATGYLDLYKRAATTCQGLPWTVLAAIGQVESDHGRNAGPSSAGALGPMQFLPSTWKVYGVDGDGDGKADITNPFDAIPGAAKYLCASGGGKGGQNLYKAIFAYNHADWYVQKVLNLAAAYARQYS
jgi:membrane-bound lytic murein transglycosylase B